MFSAFAAAQDRAVPAVRLRRVNGERLSVADIGDAATGKREYAVVVVRTIRNVKRGLDRER